LGSMAYALSMDSTGSRSHQDHVPLFAMGLFTCCMVVPRRTGAAEARSRYSRTSYVMMAAAARWADFWWAWWRRTCSTPSTRCRWPGGLARCWGLVLKAGPGAEVVSALAAADAHCGGCADGGADRVRGDADPDSCAGRAAGAQLLMARCGSAIAAGYPTGRHRTLTHGQSINHVRAVSEIRRAATCRPPIMVPTPGWGPDHPRKTRRPRPSAWA